MESKVKEGVNEKKETERGMGKAKMEAEKVEEAEG